MSAARWDVLLHDWVVVLEHEDGYVLGRCRVCGSEELLDLVRRP